MPPLVLPQIALSDPAPAAAPASPPPEPSPAPSAAPRRHSFMGSGPIELTGIGSVDLSTRGNGRNGITQSTTGYLTSGQLGLDRRTDQTDLTLSQGIGYGSGQSSYGQIEANYRTPKYSLDYGAVSSSGDTQLQIGGFARGIRLTKPRPNGDDEFFAAAAFQSDSTGFRAFGYRRFVQRRKSTQSFTLLQETALHGIGSNRIADLVLKRYAETGTATFEVALAQPHDLTNALGGNEVAYGLSLDHSGRNGYASLTATAEPNGFASLNQVLFPQGQVQTLFRRNLGQSSGIALNLGADETTVNGAKTSDRLANLSFNTTLHGVSVTLLDNLAATSAPDQMTVNRGLGVIFNETFRGTSLSQSVQDATTDGTGGLAVNRQINLSETRPIAGGYVNLSQSYGRSSANGSNGSFTDDEFAFSRSIGRKVDLGVSYGLQNQTTNGVSIPTAITTFSITRRLSKAVALRVSSSVSRQGGPTPGTSTSFTADLVGPFAFGAAARASGRINPNLPATIRGRVYNIPGGNDFTAAGATQRGVGNVLVVLDGTITQRTDSTGEFEFRFIKAGTHTVAIEPATLGAGLVADRQRQTLTVQGGQILAVDFGVGNFAGVTGRVYTRVNGVETGIPDVVVSIDDLQRVVTDQDGRYSAGRLAAGAHKLLIDPATLPSNAMLDGGFAAKTVTAVNGIVVTADFRAQRLGSIAGTVLFTADNGFGDLRGAKDVYVVANPGDHAAITDVDGSFIIDNLPAGKYTLTIDKDTLPEGQDVVQGPDDAVDVVPDQKLNGVVFKLGTGAKEVVFTFNGSKKSPVSISSDIAAGPPGALVHVTVKVGSKTPKSVRFESDVFGNFPLVDAGGGAWTGSFLIPATVQKGDFALHASVDGDAKGADTTIAVDPKVPLVLARIAPDHPSPGHNIHVVARIYAPVAEGDEIRFPDGYTIKLPKPRGRIFAFDVRLWTKGLPYDGSIVTKTRAVVPFVLK